MTSLSEKALKLLQADFGESSSSFICSELVSKGFSNAEATAIIKELEENGCIYVKKTYVNGTSAYALL